MKKILLLTSFLLVVSICKGQLWRQLTSDCFQNVYYLRIPISPDSIIYSYGSCSIIYYDSTNYLISAKHVVPNNLVFKDSIGIELFQSDQWEHITLQPHYHLNENVDIVVFKLPWEEQVSNLYLHEDIIRISSDAYILGFPNHMKTAPKNQEFNNGLPLPFAKKGVVSGIITENNISYFILDIIGNKVYSGGPSLNFDNKNNRWAVFGIISQRIPNALIKNDSNYYETGFTATVNSQHIKEIIESMK